MSSETAISLIETVENKLKKYYATQQNDKVKEYLLKLHNTTISPALLRETKIDVLVNQLASDNKSSYYSTAKALLKKWQNKNLLPNTTNTFKVKTITNTNQTVLEKKTTVKRKSGHDEDDNRHSNRLSESQSSDEYKTNDRDQPPSTNKKRKVLSFAEYKGNKKSNSVSSSSSSSSSSTVETAESKLTDTQIKEIYAQFNAIGEELVASVPDLATNVNKKLTQNLITTTNRNDLIAHDQHKLNLTTVEPVKTQQNHFWEDEDDDDDSDDDRPQPVKSKIKRDTQQAKQSATNIDDHSITSSVISLDHSLPSSRPSQSQHSTVPKNSGNFNFLRPREGRQAIYSGKRTLRTTIPSLQDLCVETLKDHVDDACRTHFNRLPYDIVKPIVESATPEQLYKIIDNNPDYVDDVEPLWQQFCSIHFKEAVRDEWESFSELYTRKFEEKEERLHRYTELAKRKKAETIDTARQTKPLNIRQPTNHLAAKSSKVARQVIGLPPSKPPRGQAKMKKQAMPPLMKKALKAYSGKG